MLRIPIPKPKGEQRRTSDILLEILTRDEAERVSIGELIDRLGDRAFGVLILLCALPNCIPGPPGLSTVTGLPIVVFSLQLMLGGTRPWLPEYLRRRDFHREDILRMVKRAEPWIRKLERLSRPRLTLLVDGVAERFAGLFLFLLSVILILPIPLGNLFPAIAIAVIAVALMEQDGIAVIVGYAWGAISVFIALTAVIIVLAVIGEFLSRLFG